MLEPNNPPIPAHVMAQIRRRAEESFRQRHDATIKRQRKANHRLYILSRGGYRRQ